MGLSLDHFFTNPDGTEGIARVELKATNQPTITLVGCAIRLLPSDRSLRNILKVDANYKKVNYFIFVPWFKSCRPSSLNNVTISVKLHRYENNDKTFKIESFEFGKYENDNYLVIPCKEKNFQRSSFLEKWSSDVLLLSDSAQLMKHSKQLSINGFKENNLPVFKFHKIDVEKIPNSTLNKLEDQGVLLIRKEEQDRPYVVGCYKKDNGLIKMFCFLLKASLLGDHEGKVRTKPVGEDNPNDNGHVDVHPNDGAAAFHAEQGSTYTDARPTGPPGSVTPPPNLPAPAPAPDPDSAPNPDPDSAPDPAPVEQQGADREHNNSEKPEEPKRRTTGSEEGKVNEESSSKHQIPAEVEGTREAENQLFPVPVQEQAIQKAEPLASEILRHKETMDKISNLLDKRSPVLSNWENLAYLIDAPQDIQAKCKRATPHSPTKLLFESFKSLKQTENLLVIELMQILRELQRNDAVEVIENHIPSHEREKRLVSEAITDKEEILDDLAIKLDEQSKVLKNWNDLGLKLKVKKEFLQEIENGNSPNAVQSLFEYIYSTMPDLTVEKFREIMVKIERMDVKKLLAGVQTGKMKEVIPLHSDLMCSICFMLNKKIIALKDWRHLASELGIDDSTYRSFEPDPPESPTSVLLNWKVSDNPGYTVREFCTVLKKMERFDAIEILENFRSPP